MRRSVAPAAGGAAARPSRAEFPARPSRARSACANASSSSSMSPSATMRGSTTASVFSSSRKISRAMRPARRVGRYSVACASFAGSVRASKPSTSLPSTSAAITVRRNGADTGTLKTRMGCLIRDQAASWHGRFPGAYPIGYAGFLYCAWGCFRDFGWSPYVIPGRCEASNPESRDSPVRNCAPAIWSFGPSRNDRRPTPRWRERPLPPPVPRRGFRHASTRRPAAARTAAPARWRGRTFGSAKIRLWARRRTATAT